MMDQWVSAEGGQRAPRSLASAAELFRPISVSDGGLAIPQSKRRTGFAARAASCLRRKRWLGLFVLAALLVACIPKLGAATRIKDLTDIEGVRDNQLIGYGLVVGLAGTGDRFQTQFTVQTIRNLLDRMGVSVPQTMLRVTNTAAVMVTATLPPFSQSGSKIDVTVAAMGDATNLSGGILLLTPLRGVNGEIYAMSQGAVATGGFLAGRQQLGTVSSRNHANTGRIANGAIVERAAPTAMPSAEVKLQLRQSDFANAARIAAAINEKFQGSSPPLANATHAGLVTVKFPENSEDGGTAFIAKLESITIETERAARIVVNERTGTIIIGSDVQIAPVSMMHGSISVEIQTQFDVSQPAPLGQGQTQAVPEVNVRVREDQAQHVSLDSGATIEDLVRALNVIGVTSRDIISILQALKAAGALEAELEVI